VSKVRLLETISYYDLLMQYVLVVLYVSSVFSRTGHSSFLVGSETVTKQQIVMNNVNIVYKQKQSANVSRTSISCSVCSYVCISGFKTY
jgi:hypothetical protein